MIPLAGGRVIEGPASLHDLLLAIEVLSPSTVALDRYEKRRAYLREGVREYWIVDPDARFVERWRPEGDVPEILRDRIAWTAPRAERALDIELPALFDRSPSRVAPGLHGCRHRDLRGCIAGHE